MVKITRYADHVDIQKEDGNFCTVNFADMQLSTRHWLWKGKIYKTLQKEANIALTENPDIITLTGDQGYSHIVANFLFSRFMHKTGRFWAHTYGNHDHEEYTLPLDIAQKICMRKSSCLYTLCPKEMGHGNYFLRFLDGEGKVVRAFIFLDSGSQVLTLDQVSWYEEVVTSLCKDYFVPTTVITHTPLPAYKEAFEEKKKRGEEPTLSKEKGFFGRDAIDVMKSDGGLFDKICRLKSTDSVLVGHDHKNSFCLEYRGVKLIFAVKTGIGGYYDKSINGFTLMRFGKNFFTFKQNIIPIE